MRVMKIEFLGLQVCLVSKEAFETSSQWQRKECCPLLNNNKRTALSSWDTLGSHHTETTRKYRLVHCVVVCFMFLKISCLLSYQIYCL